MKGLERVTGVLRESVDPEELAGQCQGDFTVGGETVSVGDGICRGGGTFRPKRFNKEADVSIRAGKE